MADKTDPGPTSITITKDGKQWTGYFRVDRGIVTVTTLHGRKSTQIGGSTAENVARMLLRELVAEGKAGDE